MARLLAPRLLQRASPRHFEGGGGAGVLTGVRVGPGGSGQAHAVVDGAGAVWRVRPLGNAVLRRRHAWAWERVPDEAVARLLPRILEQAVR